MKLERKGRKILGKKDIISLFLAHCEEVEGCQ